MDITIIPPHDGDTEDPTDFALRLQASAIHAGVAHNAARDSDAVILWRPDRCGPEKISAMLGQVRSACPRATLLVYTQGRIDLAPAEDVLLSNSPLRLYGDCLALREWLKTPYQDSRISAARGWTPTRRDSST